MLVLICVDGLVRVGEGGGVTAYESSDEIAGVADPPIFLDLTVERVSCALARIGKPWWQRALERADPLSWTYWNTDGHGPVCS